MHTFIKESSANDKRIYKEDIGFGWHHELYRTFLKLALFSQTTDAFLAPRSFTLP